jgi:hypothetical protein
MRRSTIPCRKSELRLLCRYFSAPGGAVPRHRSGEGGANIFLAFSGDNPLKTLDLKEQKKGKGTKRKEKKAKPLFKESV